MCTVRYMFFVFEKSNFIISILFRLIINNSNRLQHFVLICVLNNLSLVLVFISTLAICTVFHYHYHCHHHHVYLRTNTPFKSSDIFFNTYKRFINLLHNINICLSYTVTQLNFKLTLIFTLCVFIYCLCSNLKLKKKNLKRFLLFKVSNLSHFYLCFRLFSV